MSIYLLSVLVMIVGLLMYALASPQNAKTAEIGRIMFFCGLLSFLLMGGGAKLAGFLH